MKIVVWKGKVFICLVYGYCFVVVCDVNGDCIFGYWDIDEDKVKIVRWIFE